MLIHFSIIMNKLCFLLLMFICHITICQDEAPSLQGEASEIPNWQKEIRLAKHDTTRLKYIDKIASTYLYINTDSTYTYILKAEKIANRLPLTFSKLYFWTTCGNYYYYLNNYEKATFFYNRVLSAAIKLKHNDAIKVMKFNLTAVTISSDNFVGALKYSYDLQAFLDSIHEKNKIYYFQLYGGLSTIYLNIKNTEKTIEFASKSLLYCTSKPDSMYYYKRMFDATYKEYSWHKKTLFFYAKGLHLAKEIQNLQVEIQFYTGIAEFYILTKEYPKALFYAQKAESIAKKNGFNETFFYATLSMGKAYLGLKEYTKSISYLNRVIPYFRKSSLKYDLLDALQVISKAYRSINDYRNADKSNIEFIDLNNKIFAKEKQQTAAELEIRFKIDEKEKLLKANQLAITLQRKQIQVEYNQKILISIFLLIATLLALWTFRNYLKKNSLNKALSKEKILVETQAQQLSELNVLKDKMFAVIGHDLRSPMVGLQLKIQQLQNVPDIPQNLNTSLSKLQNKVNTISEILNNLLDWSVSQIKGELLVKKPLNLQVYINESLALYEHIIKQKSISVANQISPDIIINFNESQLEAILRNVISNALKFTPNDGVIRIYSDLSEPNCTKLIIKDSGVGISPEKLKFIFNNPSSQLGTSGEQGTGLGLRVCKDILTSQGGTIDIESQIEKGTKVVLSFLNNLCSDHLKSV